MLCQVACVVLSREFQCPVWPCVVLCTWQLKNVLNLNENIRILYTLILESRQTNFIESATCCGGTCSVYITTMDSPQYLSTWPWHWKCFGGKTVPLRNGGWLSNFCFKPRRPLVPYCTCCHHHRWLIELSLQLTGCLVILIALCVCACAGVGGGGLCRCVGSCVCKAGVRAK